MNEPLVGIPFSARVLVKGMSAGLVVAVVAQWMTMVKLKVSPRSDALNV